MLIFSSLLGVYQLVGKPLQCWCQSEYSGPRCEYATQYCYITNFYVPISNTSGTSYLKIFLPFKA